MKIKDTTVCLRLGEERKRLNLSQIKVARYCEVNVKSVGRWEKNIPIPADKLALMAQLGYDITYILTGIKLAPQVAGLEAASQVWNTQVFNSNDDTDKSQQVADAISRKQEAWLDVLESLAGGDKERFRQICLALISSYSQARTKQSN